MLFPAHLITAAFLTLLIPATLQAQTTTGKTPTATLSSAESNQHSFYSPGKQVRVDLSLKDGSPYWNVHFNQQPVLLDSLLGISPKASPYQSLKTIEIQTTSFDETWKPVWGKSSSVKNHYRQIHWQVQETAGKQRQWSIFIRIYNNAVTVKYHVPGTGSQTFSANLSEFHFTADHTCWSANGEKANHGPVPLSQFKGSQLPLTVNISDNCYVAIVEAAIQNFAPIQLKRISPTSFKAQMDQSKVNLPTTTSWLTLLLGKTPGDLLINDTLINLNPPCQIQDTSWIKPGIAMWDWRSWGAKTDDGFTYGLDMESWKRQIDFAAKHNLGYLLLDAGWYGLEFDPKEDPTTCRDHLIIQPDPNKPRLVRKPAPKNWEQPIDVPALIRYGKAKNVGIILYLNDAAQKNHNLKQTLATYQEWGAAGIKYGFMRAEPQEKVLKTRKIVELCAQHKLLCDFHDHPIAPSGDRRTFPNYITREFCHAQSDAKRTFSPKTFCTSVFTNMLTGPLDMCNGLYAINNAKATRPKIFSELYSTVTAETARVLITYSGLALLPDIPEAYEAKSDLFEFIAKLPMTWDESRVLNGQIGKHITMARRQKEQWFIASCCDENGAKLSISLDFLKPDTNYTATLYEDAHDTHYKTNREAYSVKTITVQKGDTVTATLAPGGGHCIRLTPTKL